MLAPGGAGPASVPGQHPSPLPLPPHPALLCSPLNQCSAPPPAHRNQPPQPHTQPRQNPPPPCALASTRPGAASRLHQRRKPTEHPRRARACTLQAAGPSNLSRWNPQPPNHPGRHARPPKGCRQTMPLLHHAAAQHPQSTALAFRAGARMRAGQPCAPHYPPGAALCAAAAGPASRAASPARAPPSLPLSLTANMHRHFSPPPARLPATLTDGRNQTGAAALLAARTCTPACAHAAAQKCHAARQQPCRCVHECIWSSLVQALPLQAPHHVAARTSCPCRTPAPSLVLHQHLCRATAPVPPTCGRTHCCVHSGQSAGITSTGPPTGGAPLRWRPGASAVPRVPLPALPSPLGVAEPAPACQLCTAVACMLASTDSRCCIIY